MMRLGDRADLLSPASALGRGGLESIQSGELYPGTEGVALGKNQVIPYCLMATPCRKCGATKTEPSRHGPMHRLARRFGYRLRRCARCHRMRLVPLDEPRDFPNDERLEGLDTSGHESPPDEALKEPAGPTCPRCGKSDYRRSRRRWWEHLLHRPHMVRCRSCRTRFPLPDKTLRAAA